MLSIPEHANIIDLPPSCIWREESGIICPISKKTKAQTLEQAKELPKIAKAIAMVSGSALGRMPASLFFNLKSQPYPSRCLTMNGRAEAGSKKISHDLRAPLRAIHGCSQLLIEDCGFGIRFLLAAVEAGPSPIRNPK